MKMFILIISLSFTASVKAAEKVESLQNTQVDQLIKAPSCPPVPEHAKDLYHPSGKEIDGKNDYDGADLFVNFNVFDDNVLKAQLFKPYHTLNVPEVPLGDTLEGEITSGVRSGTVINENNARKIAIYDDHWVLIPGQIDVFQHWRYSLDEAWRFPNGTIFIHRMFLKKKYRDKNGNSFPMTPLEYRVIKKADQLKTPFWDDKWIFASYSPKLEYINNSTEFKSKWHLRKIVDQNENLEIEIDVDQGEYAGNKVKIHFKRENPNACRMCHQAHSPNSSNYCRADLIGPCGFGPSGDNGPHLKNIFKDKFRSVLKDTN